MKQARFTGLLRNTTYWVAVHPIDVVGNQPAALISYPVELKDKLAPDEVQGLKASSLATGLALEWTLPQNDDLYQLRLYVNGNKVADLDAGPLVITERHR